MILRRGPTEYYVGDLVAEASAYRLYACRGDDERELLLQIASETACNGKLERVAFILRDLMETAGRYEEVYANLNPGKQLGYGHLLPEVVDSFVCDEQGKRRINILALYKADRLIKVVPLSNITALDRRRVDLSASAWILGRLLKLLVFIHGEGTAVRGISGNNVLIQPERHTVAVLDWTSALTYQVHEEVVREQYKADIVNAAQAVFIAIGGDPETGSYPYDADGAERYIEYLRQLCMGNEIDAETAHHRFYDLVNELYGFGFREFRTYPL